MLDFSRQKTKTGTSEIFSDHIIEVFCHNALYKSMIHIYIYINWVLRNLKSKTQRSGTPSLESDMSTFVLYSSDTHNADHGILLAVFIFNQMCRVSIPASNSRCRNCRRLYTWTFQICKTSQMACYTYSCWGMHPNPPWIRPTSSVCCIQLFLPNEH